METRNIHQRFSFRVKETKKSNEQTTKLLSALHWTWRYLQRLFVRLFRR